MPVYEFACNSCKKTFTVTMRISELGETAVTCPKCKSDDTRQLLTSFTAKTRKKS